MLERLLDSLYESLGEYPMWRTFLGRLAAGCDAEFAFIVIEPGRDQLPAAFVSHDEILPQIKACLERGLFQGMPPGHFGTDTRRTWLESALVVSAEFGTAGRFHVGFWRGSGAKGLDRAAEGILFDLVPGLRRAIGLYLSTAVLHRRLEVLTTATEAADLGIVLVDRDGAVLQTNSIADEILRIGDGLRVLSGRLRASDPVESAVLSDHIREKAREQTQDTDWSNYEPVSLSRAESALPLTTIVRPGPAFRPAASPLRRTAILILRDPSRQNAIPPVILSRLFGLTRASALLASKLASGLSLKDAAGDIGISHNTARVQLQNIFSKTGTNRQHDLVRLLLNSAATLSR
ncbi:MAG TPA: helix-turn-helix transcriptional regulator [Alphaproteobacteria bacterium]|nr:helix-turn-helix transcriptional regulator [Alphaproteobacteria bacterium]